MPWKSPKAAIRHTRKAATPRLKSAWLKAANSALKHYRDEGTAVRVANSVVKKMTAKKSTKKSANKHQHSAATRLKISKALKKYHRNRRR